MSYVFIQVVNMHGYLKTKYDEGQLWWDQVHLTDYGNYLFTKKLFEDLKVNCRMTSFLFPTYYKQPVS